MDGQTTSPSPPTNTDSDVMSVASIVGVTETQIMSNRPKTHPQARPTHHTLQGTSVNWRQCTRSQGESLTQSHHQRCFYPILTSSKFWSLPMPRPTHQKTTKTMMPRRRSTPSLPLHTNPRKTPRLPHLSL